MQLISRGMSESKAVNFTAVKCADGITSADPTKVTNLIGANPIDMVLSKVAYNATDQTTEITANITNSGLVASKIISEYGIFAKCAGDATSVLFGYKNNKDTPEVLYPSAGGSQYIERVFKCSIGSFSNVGDEYVHDYSNSENVSSLYFKKIITGLLGVAQTTFTDSLPDNTGNWGWFDGGEIKKTDYPDLWLRVKPEVDNAVIQVTNGTWEYLGSNNSKSYFGWYKGTTDEYFRKPNVMESGHYLRPVSNSGGRKSGVHQVQNIQSHTHGADSAGAGSHNHSGTTSSDGNHRHFAGVSYDNQGGGYVSWAQQQFDNSNPIYTDYQGTHSHTMTTTTVAAHSHTISVYNTGGVETTPPNIAVKVYGLIRF